MSESKKPLPEGSDWTHLLTDPDLASHLSVLLKTYREVAPEKRAQALLEAMREIKEKAIRSRAKEYKDVRGQETMASQEAALFAAPEPINETPPFEPDLFAATTSSDRRRFMRMKCNIAVEIRVEGTYTPVWGTLANVGRGGCLVETAGLVPANKALEIGIWVASGKIWVKGVVITGVSGGTPSCRTHVRFSRAELSEKEHLREFLKFIEGETRKSQSEKNYVAKLKA